MLLKVLAVVVPLALVGAVSPMMLSEQTFLLSGRDGRRVAARYALGVVLTLLVILSALVLFGRSLALPKEPTLSASLDIVLGSLLVLLAVALEVRRRRHRPTEPRSRALGPGAAFGFGVFSMATNFTTMAVLVPAAKEIAAGGLEVVGRVVAILVVVVVASLPAWLPLVLTLVAPGPAGRGLKALADFVAKRGAQLTVVLVAGLGLFLVGRGLVHVLGG
ncbi:GAP family protein [Isoptericola sp. 178]|uniref:GAP family protein n=1 Tax=Isoptericola sp. 178 TaxID=3064651 RepID=UPI00271272EE|nr:GAP family protein [Isoptericola sp. 178]MDO8143310.1 GAP family protein [Isoptericola sp. 178]